MSNALHEDAAAVTKLISFLVKHPKNDAIKGLSNNLPGGSAKNFIAKYSQFFEVFADNKVQRVRVKKSASKTGYKWQMCVPFHFKGQCPEGDSCNFRHGLQDTREKPAMKTSTAKIATPVSASVPSQSKPNPTAASQSNKSTSAPPQPTPKNVAATPLPVPAVTVPKRKFEGKNCYLVPKEKKCGEILSELMNQKIIAIDCEGVNHGPNGKLCLIQIATSLNIYVIDVCVEAAAREEIVTTLKAIFKNNTIKKILHDARNDNEALYSVGIINEHFEDTQILHGLLTSLRGKPEKKIGLKELMQHYSFNHELKTTMKANYKSDPALWAKRPLTEDMIEYAACDVANLTTVYKRLKEDIETEMMLISRNYAMPKELKLMEKTYVDAIKIQLDVKLRLFFTPEKKPDRRNLEDVFLEEVAPVRNNTNQRSDNESEERRLLSLFPDEIQWAIEVESRSKNETLIEIVIDLGRVPRIRFTNSEVPLNICGAIKDMEPFVNNIFANSQRTDFSRENRIGIEGSLHRISAIKNADGRVIGLTYRIGRHLPRSAEIITDLIARVAPSLESTVDHAPQNTSILLLGPPGTYNRPIDEAVY
jgi:ribonuclease D